MIKSMSQRLQLSDTVMNKAMEYQRLASVKCSALLKQCSENCVCVVCLQLASHSVGVQFDKACHNGPVAIKITLVIVGCSNKVIWSE